MEFVAFERGIEVNGRSIYSIVAGFKLIKSIPEDLLWKNGIGTKNSDGTVRINPDDWYSQQSWLDCFKELSEKTGQAILFQIGLKIPENAQFPEWVTNIESAIKSIDIAYHMNHRKNKEIMFNPQSGTMLEGIGHYGFQKVEKENKIISVCNNPYPCDFDKGIITFMARKFDKSAIIAHDASGQCRKKGADSCTYVVTW